MNISNRLMYTYAVMLTVCDDAHIYIVQEVKMLDSNIVARDEMRCCDYDDDGRGSCQVGWCVDEYDVVDRPNDDTTLLHLIHVVLVRSL